MWTLFIILLISWIFTKVVLNLIEIFTNIEETISQKRFDRELEDSMRSSISEALKSRDEDKNEK